MGPSGCGKSTLGMAIGDRLRLPFIEGDDCHPPENIAKMRRGEPLTDADRWPFLDAVGRALAACPDGAVASCSSLKRAYRDRLRAHRPDLLFVLPELPRAVLASRLARRGGHFMPDSLLASQMDELERPAADENAILIDGELGVDEQVDRICECFEIDDF